MATAVWRVYASPMDGTRVERKADLKAVAWRRVESTAIVVINREQVWNGVCGIWDDLESEGSVFTLWTLWDDMSSPIQLPRHGAEL